MLEQNKKESTRTMSCVCAVSVISTAEEIPFRGELSSRISSELFPRCIFLLFLLKQMSRRESTPRTKKESQQNEEEEEIKSCW